MAHSRNPLGPLHIELELAREMAGGLRRVGEKLEALLAELGRLEQQLPGLQGEARTSAVARHAHLRAEALKQRYHLHVQREAMGLRQHGDLDELYPIPAALH
jgi:hypothetical protein